MARTDNDSWEITESVGSTALGVAAARAAETDSDEPADPGSVRAGVSRRGRRRHVEPDRRIRSCRPQLTDLEPDLSARTCR